MTWPYRVSRLAGRFIFLCTMRTNVLHPERAGRGGGYVLALTHLSHLEPFASVILMPRPTYWMARKEFFRGRLRGAYLRAMGVFSVDREGSDVRAVRTAIAHARRGRVVGICPEGGVRVGPASAMRGGPIKRGACSVAIRAGVPIVPCAMLGTDKLNAVRPWLPFKRARLWVAYGEPIFPPPGARSTRSTRATLAQQLSSAYQNLYAELRAHYGVRDEDVS